MRGTAARALAAMVTLALASAARAQLDQPLPPPPERAEPAPAPKLTKPPAVKKTVEPVYPPEAFAAGLAGDVTLTLDLDAEGHVTNVVVSKGAGHGFDEAAAAAARELEFSPAEVDGKPSPIRIEYTIHFKPRVVPAPEPETAPEPEPEAEPPPQPPPVTVRLTVRGRARERGTREPIAAADVAVIRRGAAIDGGDLPADVVTTTDDAGRFEVHAEAPGGLRVIVSDATHEPCIRDFSPAELAGPTPASWECLTRVRAGGAYETRVQARAEHPEETKQTLTRAELSTVPGTANDPLRVIQDLPGVARAPYGLGVLIVRGASPAETGVFIGGEPVPLLYHFLAGPSIFSSYLIDKIDFYPGGFGVRYGRFAGGAVDITIKGDVGKTLHGAADINLRDSSAYVEGPVADGWKASFAARRSYIDAILPLIIKPKIGSTFVTLTPVYWDYQGRVDKDLPGGRFALVAYGSDDAFKVLAQDPTREITSDTHIGFHHVMGEWLTTVGNGWTSRLAATYGYGNQSFDTGSAFNGFQRYHRLYGREDLSKRLTPSFAISGGLDVVLSYDWAVYNIELPPQGRTLGTTMPVPENITRSLYDTAPAVYLEAQWDVVPRLRITPGIRFDYYHVVGTNKSSLDPRLAARLAVSPSFAIKASVGLYHELPTPQYLDTEFGNPNLLLPWAAQVQLGIEKRFTPADDLSATAFFVRRYDLPVPSIDHFSSLGGGRSYGLEILLRHQITRHFYGWLAYTLSRSEVSGILAEDIPVGTMGMPRNGADVAWRPGQFDQPHNLVAVASYRFSNWETGLTYRLTSGTPVTPVVGAFYDADFNGYTRENGAAGSARNPTFSQLDARVERTFMFDKWVLGIYLDVQNVLYSDNPEGTLYDYRYRESAPLRGLPILPILGIRGRF